jgi:hypothetical protein
MSYTFVNLSVFFIIYIDLNTVFRIVKNSFIYINFRTQYFISEGAIEN